MQDLQKGENKKGSAFNQLKKGKADLFTQLKEQHELPDNKNETDDKMFRAYCLQKLQQESNHGQKINTKKILGSHTHNILESQAHS